MAQPLLLEVDDQRPLGAPLALLARLRRLRPIAAAAPLPASGPVTLEGVLVRDADAPSRALRVGRASGPVLVYLEGAEVTIAGTTLATALAVLRRPRMPRPM